MKKSINLKRLRLMVDDSEGDTETFSDADYIEMYEEHDTIYCLAAEIWLLKAAELQSAYTGGVKGYKSGDESYDMTELKDLLSHAMTMHAKYQELCVNESKPERSFAGGVLLNMKRPDVL